MRVKSETNRTKILQAAKVEFLQAGAYASVSVDAIAKQAGVTKQTVYNYFSTKESLFIAVITSIIGHPWDDGLPWSAAIRYETRQDFQMILLGILGIVRTKFTDKDYLAVLRIVIAESKTQPELATLYRQQIIEKAFAALQAILEHAKEKGVIRIDAAAGTRMLVGSMLTYLFMRGICSPSEEFTISDEELQTIVANFLIDA